MSEEKIERKRLIRLETITNEFANCVAQVIRDCLNISVDLFPIAIEFTTYKELLRQLPFPALVSHIDIEPYGKKMLTTMDTRFISNLINIIMGGRACDIEIIKGREISTIEQILMHRLDKVFCYHLEKALSSVFSDVLLYSRSFTNTSNCIFGFADNTECVEVTFECTTNNVVSCYKIAIPSSFIIPVVGLFSQDSNLKVFYKNEKILLECLARQKEKEKEYKDLVSASYYNKQKYFQNLVHLDPLVLMTQIKDDIADVIACIFSYLPTDFVAECVLHLTATKSASVLYKMKNICIPNAVFLEDIEDYLNTFSKNKTISLSTNTETILRAVGEKSPTVKKEIERQFFSPS